MSAAAEPRRRLLLIVADAESRGRLSRGRREVGYGVHSAKDAAAALPILAAEPIDLIVAERPEDSALLAPLLTAGPTLLLIGRARDRQIEQARAAIAAGAYDYLPASVQAPEI